MRQWVLFFYYIICYGLLLGQTHYKQFRLQDGFPSNEVYDICQDELGYLWFATDHGLARYDGFQFRVFTTKDGLADNTILSFFETEKGIFYNYYAGGLGQIINGQARDSDISDLTKKCCGDPYLHISKLIARQDTIWFCKLGDKHKHIYQIELSKQAVTTIELQEKEIGIQRGDISLISRDYYNKPTEHALIFDKEGYIEGSSSINNVFSHAGYTYANTNYHFYNTDKSLSFQSDSPILRIKHFGAWYLATKNGIYVLDAELKIQQRLLVGKYITGIWVDNAKNIWASTHNEGIIYIPAIQTEQVEIDFQDGNFIQQLTKFNHQIIGYGKHYPFYNLTTASTIELGSRTVDIENIQPIRNFLTHGYGMKVVIDTMWQVQSLPSYNYHHFRNDTLYELVIGDPPSKNNSLHAPISNLLSEPIITKSFPMPSAMRKSKLFRNFIAIWNKDFYCEMDLQNGSCKEPHRSKDLQYTRIIDVEEAPIKDFLAFATKNKGVLLRYKNKILPIQESDGLASIITKDVCFENDSTLWVASYKGLNKVHLGWSPSLYVKDIEHFNRQNLLPYDDLEFCEILDGELWFGSKSQIHHVPTAAFQFPKIVPRLDLKTLSDQDTTYQASNTLLQLSKYQRDIRIHYQAIAFSNQGKVHYRYRLRPNNAEWRITTNNSVQFSDLVAQHYQFEVQTSTDGEEWSEKQVLEFRIAPKLTETPLFKLLLGGAILLAAVGLGYWFNQRRLRKVLQEKRIIESEQKALRSQMNPHFIFNALNSIQYYIARNEKYEANIYLAEFAQLVRQTFEHSKHGLIPIEEELSLLKNYVSLEQMRFSDKMEVDWNIQIDNKKAFVPTMLVQPFIENAIWHGISPLKNRRGKLQIDCIEMTDTIQFKISDNGKGIEHSRKRKKSRGSGISITEERLMLYEKEFGKPMTYDIQSSNTGTVVSISLSKLEL